MKIAILFLSSAFLGIKNTSKITPPITHIVQKKSLSSISKPKSLVKFKSKKTLDFLIPATSLYKYSSLTFMPNRESTLYLHPFHTNFKGDHHQIKYPYIMLGLAIGSLVFIKKATAESFTNRAYYAVV